jgi:hypothetical protein
LELALLGMNTSRSISGEGPAAKEPAPVETADPRLTKLLKLVEQVRVDRLRQGLFFKRPSD